MAITIPEQARKRLDTPNSKTFYCPFCCRLTVSPGNIKVNTALCAMCASMERHRVLTFLYDQYGCGNEGARILHIAPEKCLYDKLSAEKAEYLAADLNPANFPFIAPGKIVREDGMNMSFGENTFDFVIHNHVLEHVLDDEAFIVECLRVLKDDGKCIACFPYEPQQASNFDTCVTTPEEREKVFGWHDHLRLYGYDFLKHFRQNTYSIDVAFQSGKACALFTPDERRYMKLDAVCPGDAIIVITKRDK